jgi:hypothetical protein
MFVEAFSVRIFQARPGTSPELHPTTPTPGASGTPDLHPTAPTPGASGTPELWRWSDGTMERRNDGAMEQLP